MLGSFRKFSTSIYAKVLLAIVVIPFVFWGMGSAFKGGNKNVIVKLDYEKYSVQEFINFIKRNANKKINKDDVENLLSSFIGEKLMEKEIESLGIKLTDNSLSKLIRHQKSFKKNEKFSRTEYEKFLLTNNITATDFESIISREEKKKELLDLIGGGISAPKFSIYSVYDKINQKREIQLINLNDAFDKEINFTEDEITSHYEKNKNNYIEIYKTINLIELSPKMLVDQEDYNDLFFKKIDEIDDAIVDGEEFDKIIKNFNLTKPASNKINNIGKNISGNVVKKYSKKIIDKIFSLDESEKLVLFENNNKFFIFEIINSEHIVRDLKNKFVKDSIINNLKSEIIRKQTAEIVTKIVQNGFNKTDFDAFSVRKKISVQKITLNSLNDDKILKKEAVRKIYEYSEKKVIVVNDLSFSKNYLIYIDEIKKADISEDSEDYVKYKKLSEMKMITDLYNSYDNYLKKKYKIDINNQAIDVVKSYFN